MKKNVALFILAVILLINSVPALSVAADEIEKVKTLNVRIAKEYHEHGKFTAEDFPELELESLYIMSDSKYEIADVYYREICYYFVLKTAITIEEMKNFAKNNPYVEEAYIGYTEPFEGTIKLNVPEGKKIEIEVGESLNLKFLGAKGYTKPFSFSYVVVCLDKYDDNREYEPKDFPEVALSKIKHEEDKVYKEMNIEDAPEEEEKNNKLAGITFCITGRLKAFTNRGALVEVIVSQGGKVVVNNGDVVSKLPLPIAGLMSDKEFNYVLEKCAELNNASHSIGCTLEDPFMTLAFMSLPVIPELKITDKGLFDTNKFEFVK